MRDWRSTSSDRGDDWGTQGDKAYYRWFSRQRIRLEPGEHELTVPLDREHWGAVIRTDHTEAQQERLFQAAIRNPAVVGFTFGGGEGAAKGVKCTGRHALHPAGLLGGGTGRTEPSRMQELLSAQ